MSDTKKKLIALVGAIQEENIIEYCYSFIGLKVYGEAKLPESITIDLRKMYNEYLIHQGCDLSELDLDSHEDGETESERELVEAERKSEDCRCSIIQTLYSIKSSEILTYIRIIAEDVAKEDQGGGADVTIERREAIEELIKEAVSINSTAKIRFISNVVKNYKKGGAEK